jgi:hypothetical protein
MSHSTKEKSPIYAGRFGRAFEGSDFKAKELKISTSEFITTPVIVQILANLEIFNNGISHPFESNEADNEGSDFFESMHCVLRCFVSSCYYIDKKVKNQFISNTEK